MQVEVKAQASIYEARGEFQLNVEAMRRAGLGALFEAFARLKEKLEREGLFDAARKRPLPAFPGRIGIVTSAKAAALRDVLTTLKRRWPSAALILYPTLVQGKGAAEQIAAALASLRVKYQCPEGARVRLEISPITQRIGTARSTAKRARRLSSVTLMTSWLESGMARLYRLAHAGRHGHAAATRPGHEHEAITRLSRCSGACHVPDNATYWLVGWIIVTPAPAGVQVLDSTGFRHSPV